VWPAQTIAAEALAPDIASIPAPIAAHTSDFLRAVILNPPLGILRHRKTTAKAASCSIFSSAKRLKPRFQNKIVHNDALQTTERAVA
jgi:hypothetical protein